MTNDNREMAIRLLFGHIEERQQNLRSGQTRLVHYTRAETCLQIIRKPEIWLRNARCMNDFEEVAHGVEQISSYFANGEPKKFWLLLDEIDSNLGDQIKEHFDKWIQDLQFETYITCFSEHPQDEDGIGRLSMWRAYGGLNGAAIVINPQVMVTDSDALKAYSYPVFYFTSDEFKMHFDAFVSKLTDGKDILLNIGSGDVLRGIIHFLHSHAFCVKHPGFKEELEWRIVYRPNYSSSKYIKSEIYAINGVPQRIFKLPLENIPDENFYGADLSSLIHHIIVGPCEHPLTAASALIDALAEAKIEGASEKVRISNIPLRI